MPCGQSICDSWQRQKVQARWVQQKGNSRRRRTRVFDDGFKVFRSSSHQKGHANWNGYVCAKLKDLHTLTLRLCSPVCKALSNLRSFARWCQALTVRWCFRIEQTHLKDTRFHYLMLHSHGRSVEMWKSLTPPLWRRAEGSWSRRWRRHHIDTANKLGQIEILFANTKFSYRPACVRTW